MKLPTVVTPEEWQQANTGQITKEKAQTQRRDALGAARRGLPMVPMTGDYEFEGPDGKASLLDLFEGRSQLITYNFYFTPGDEDPCTGCSMFTDNLGHPDGLNHLRDRDATFTLVSLASQEQISEVKERMGWRYPWVTDANRQFSEDCGTTEYFKLNVFLRRGDDVYRTYWTTGRGVEALAGGATTDLLPYGRQEEWQDSPEGWPAQPAYTSGELHDSYGDEPTAPSAAAGPAPMPPIVDTEEWEARVAERHDAEKAETRERDALAAERRRQPRELIDKDYEFEGPEGEASLLEMFEGRRQLLIYHFMLEPGNEDPCGGCSGFTDQVGHISHLHQRDTSMALVSIAPREEIEHVQARMGWEIPWYSSHGSDFNADFGRTTSSGEMFGLSAFIRDGDDVYRSYFTSNRGVDGVGTTWTLLDLTALGRQEEWEDSPEGYPQTPPYGWWDLHPNYEDR